MKNINSIAKSMKYSNVRFSGPGPCRWMQINKNGFYSTYAPLHFYHVVYSSVNLFPVMFETKQNFTRDLRSEPGLN